MRRLVRRLAAAIGKLAGWSIFCLFLFSIIFVPLDCLFGPTIESGIIQKIWPNYETREERTQRINAAIQGEQECIFSGLENWLDEYFQKNLPNVKKDEYQHYSFSYYDKIGEDIWVLGRIPTLSNHWYVTNFIFHSPNNGVSWGISWPKTEDEILPYTSLSGIQIIDKQRICVQLRGTGGMSPKVWMLYTLNRGKSWLFSEGWNPGRIKKLPAISKRAVENPALSFLKKIDILYLV